MPLYPVAGSRIFIGGAPVSDKNSDFIASEFNSVTWTEIDGWSQMGPIGDTSQIITTTLINRGRDLKQKGTRNGGSMQNVFAKMDLDPGQIAVIAAEKTRFNYPIRVDLGDADTAVQSVATITIAAPGVVTWTAHGLIEGTPIKFSTTGALPTGLTPGVIYYVKYLTANTFNLATTPGGAAITTTGTQSGVHTAIKTTQRFFIALIARAQETGGEANTIRNLDTLMEINSNIVGLG
jgi:hypothetical protein